MEGRKEQTFERNVNLLGSCDSAAMTSETTQCQERAVTSRVVDSPLFEIESNDEPEVQSLSVAQLNALLSHALDTLFPENIWVDGEISGMNRAKSGHVYFDLIEPTEPGVSSPAKISCVLWNGMRTRINEQLSSYNVGKLVDGMAIRIRAKVDFYEVRGQLQLQMTGVDPRYILAAMAAERDLLIERLMLEGVAERNRQLEQPIVPQRIGLITSKGSAAEADFIDELNASGLGFTVVSCDSLVQGERAPDHLVAALRTLYLRDDLDVIVLTRGGGSRGDLSAFDNETLARTIAQAPVPVIVGVGHEIDRSVADVVAHSSFKTPTAVAAALVASVRQYVDYVEDRWHAVAHHATEQAAAQEARIIELAQRTGRAGRDGLELAEERLNNRSSRAALAGRRSLTRHAERLDTTVAALPKLADRIIRTAAVELGHTEARVKASDPAVLLARGWSITRTSQGDVVRTVKDVRSGDTLVTEVANGTIISNVSVIDPHADPTKETQS